MDVFRDVLKPQMAYQKLNIDTTVNIRNMKVLYLLLL